MKDGTLKDSFKGSKFTVIHCKGAVDSYYEALKSVDTRKHDRFTRAMIIQIKKLANGGRMSKENFPQEADLPKKVGQQHTKKFNALKRLPLRGYCWLSEKYENTYYISHYVHKAKGKLDKRDTAKVRNNWKKIE